MHLPPSDGTGISQCRQVTALTATVITHLSNNSQFSICRFTAVSTEFSTEFAVSTAAASFIGFLLNSQGKLRSYTCPTRGAGWQQAWCGGCATRIHRHGPLFYLTSTHWTFFVMRRGRRSGRDCFDSIVPFGSRWYWYFSSFRNRPRSTCCFTADGSFEPCASTRFCCKGT